MTAGSSQTRSDEHFQQFQKKKMELSVPCDSRLELAKTANPPKV